jgi:hypothetical protein
MTTIDTTQTLTTKLDIGAALTNAWHFFVKDIGPLIVGTLIAGLLSIVTLGILAGPLFAGVYSMVIGRVRDGRPAEVGDVFSQMDRFWSFAGGMLFLVVVTGLAWITIIGGVLLSTIWLYVLPLMVDRRMGFWEALGASKDLVMKAGFWEHLALVVIGAVILAVVDGPFTLLSMPFVTAGTVAAYFAVSGRRELTDRR